MKRQSRSRTCMMVLAAIGAGAVASPVRALQPPRPAGEDGLQILTRGPVHEAFAGTVTFDPEPGIVVSVAPPNPIAEMPPDQRPAGVDIAWIPGYTAWDDERNDYLWVSGVWRAPPPGRQWVSGYWGRASSGFQWTSGYWADAQLSETEYLPEPPETVEVGPHTPAPSSDHSWIPGCWIWHHGRYAWRPGYWVTVQPDWDWIPGHYTWTRRGYIFVDGYWDYSIGRRGVLFAPVYFDARVYRRPDYYYSPSTVISLTAFSDHLFVRPRYQHYYFGDYYDASYTSAGFYSRSAYRSSRSGYDPIYAHQRWSHRNDPGWEIRVERNFRHRRDNVAARPPRTLSGQMALIASGRTSGENGLVLAASLNQVAKRKEDAFRFQAVDRGEKQQLLQRGQQLRQFRQERERLETRAADRSTDRSAKRLAPARLPVPRSPIAGKRSDQLGKDRAPPERHAAPGTDPRIEGKPRKARGRPETSRADRREKPDGPSKRRPEGKSKRKSKDD